MEQLSPGDPRRIGEYRLLGRLGEGGMGQVFLARTRSGRKVALKLLRPQLAADPEFRTRFAREVAAARQVGGLHTAQVVDADADANPPWLATEYIDGHSLQQRLRRNGPMAAEALRELGAGVAEGLTAIHSVGLVHRDLKPANVIMAADGPRIIDFGIARAVDSSTFTATGTVLGTFAYMAPEQIRADRAEPAADVFALGCVLVFAATGSSPFDASTIPAVMHRVLSEQPDLDAVPDDLRELVEACLDKDSGNRPSPGEVLSRLALDDVEPPGAEPPEDVSPQAATDGTSVAAATHDQTRHWPDGETVAEAAGTVDSPVGKRVSRRTMLIGGLAVAGVAAVPIVALWPDPGSGSGEDGPVAGRYSIADDEIGNEIQVARFSPNGEILAAIVSVDGLSHVQLWDVATEDRKSELGSGETSGPDRDLAFSPDGELLATGGDTVRLWNVKSGAETRNREFGGAAVSLAFSPDGSSLAVGTDKGMSVWDLVTGGKKVLQYEAVTSVAFSPDGNLIAGLGEYESGVWRIADDERVSGLLDITEVGQLAFSPDGTTLAAATGADQRAKDAGLRIWNVDSGDRESVPWSGPLRNLAFHPDGQLIATSGESKITLRDAKTGDTKTTFNNDESRSLSFSPNGRLLATVQVHSRRTVTVYQVE